MLKVALLAGNSPTYRRFLIRSDESGDWVPSESTTVKWLLGPGFNRLYARIVCTENYRDFARTRRP